MKRIPIDVDELKKVFRIRNGNLERLNYRYPNGKWTVVDNKKIKLMVTAKYVLMVDWCITM